jgi:hypothetical protein
MDTCAEAFFHSPDGPLNLTDVTVGGDHVEVDRAEGVTEAIELVVGVYIGNSKTARGIQLDHGKEFAQNGGVFAVGHGADRAEVQVTRDRM